MDKRSQRKTMLSGIQPTGIPHLGNYLGAIRNWSVLQNEYDYLLFVADLHALTVPQDPKELHSQVFNIVAYLIAAGIDPQHCTLFVQSHVPQHLQVAWILNCMCYMGELNRMTQFKDKSKKSDENLNAGLFTYPVLQASDILLYKPHFVPVGEDQRQHIELTRDLAERFNKRYKKRVFVIPDPYIREDGGRVMDLQTPTAKMSKSADTANGVIYLNDTDDKIMKKIKSAVTDSAQAVSPENPSPGLYNLAEIYAILSNSNVKQVLEENSGKLYGHFKVQVAEHVIETLRPIRLRAEELLLERKALSKILLQGAEKARERAEKTISEVYEATGLIREKELF